MKSGNLRGAQEGNRGDACAGGAAVGMVTVYHRLYSGGHTLIRGETRMIPAPVGSCFDASETAELDFSDYDAYLSAWGGVITVTADPRENIVRLEYTVGLASARQGAPCPFCSGIGRMAFPRAQTALL